MKYGQQFANELSGTSAEVQQASIDYKQLKKSIKRIQSELQARGLNAELLKELLSAGNDTTADEDDAGEAAEAILKKSASAKSLQQQQRKAARDKKKRKQAKARAEYELAGTVDNPQPRIKLVFESASSESASSSEEDQHYALYNRIISADSAQIEDITNDEEEEEDEEDGDAEPIEPMKYANGHPPSSPHGSHTHSEKRMLLGKVYGKDILPLDQVTPPGSPRRSPTHSRNSSHVFPDAAPDSEDAGILHGPEVLLKNLDLSGTRKVDDGAEDADGEGQDMLNGSLPINGAVRQKHKRNRKPRRPRREVVINLEYDSEFFILLNQALSSLATLLNAEKAAFTAGVQSLAQMVSTTTSSAKNQKDMYAWREVFSLWVEAQIFESESERDRGERSIAEVEKRLDWFVDQVGRRQLAKKMKSKTSRQALERFVELNQELLQLKRIGMANREAARKILKKHDKRLGLSASQEFPDFVAQQQQLAHGSGELIARSALAKTADSNELTVLIFSSLTSLPHVLLSMFTDTLLPVIPQIDDYSCLICGDIAWRPIALNCGHRFCVRCLVKMQKRGQDACPACRAPVVMQANKDNLDTALMMYQKRWFPREIKLKEKDSKKEIEKEIAEEMGFDAQARCVVA